MRNLVLATGLLFSGWTVSASESNATDLQYSECPAGEEVGAELRRNIPWGLNGSAPSDINKYKIWGKALIIYARGAAEDNADNTQQNNSKALVECWYFDSEEAKDAAAGDILKIVAGFMNDASASAVDKLVQSANANGHWDIASTDPETVLACDASPSACAFWLPE